MNSLYRNAQLRMGLFTSKHLFLAFDKTNFSTFVYFQTSNTRKNPSNDFEREKKKEIKSSMRALMWVLAHFSPSSTEVRLCFDR